MASVAGPLQSSTWTMGHAGCVGGGEHNGRVAWWWLIQWRRWCALRWLAAAHTLIIDASCMHAGSSTNAYGTTVVGQGQVLS